MLTPEQLDEIRKRCEAATPGPWYADEDAFIIDDTGRCLISALSDEAFLRDEDAEFCACARTDIPALLAHIDALAAERNALAAQVAELRRALEMAVDVLADVGAGGQILHRGANDKPEQRAIHALNVAEAALDRGPSEAVRDLAAAGYIRILSVEELAEALYFVDDLAASIYGPDIMPWENRKEEVKEEYRRKARAMLEALGVKYGKGEAP